MAAHATLDRAAFLERVQVPHLFVHDLSGLLETAEFQSLRAREADTPVALSTRSEWPEELGRAGVCPVQKAENAIGTRVTVGRSAICDIPLTDARVSKAHAFFSWADGGWSLTDMGSTNGTTLDGLGLTAHAARPLRTGARIRFADLVEVVFLEPEGLWELLLDAVALIGDER